MNRKDLAKITRQSLCRPFSGLQFKLIELIMCQVSTGQAPFHWSYSGSVVVAPACGGWVHLGRWLQNTAETAAIDWDLDLFNSIAWCLPPRGGGWKIPLLPASQWSCSHLKESQVLPALWVESPETTFSPQPDFTSLFLCLPSLPLREPQKLLCPLISRPFPGKPPGILERY